MTSRTYHLTYFLFFIYLLALPASVVGRTLGCDWLNNPDPNPGKPELNSTAYHASIAPDVPVGTVMLTVSANDTDVNDTLWYLLEDCDYADFIDLDPSSGQLKVISTLMDIYALEIQCVIRVQDRENLTDSEVKTDRADLVIKIYDIREVAEDVDRTKSWLEDEYDTNALYAYTSEETTEPSISHTRIPNNKPPTPQTPSVTSTKPQTTRSTTTNIPVTTKKTTTTQKPNITYTSAPTTKTKTTQKANITYTSAPTTKTTTSQKTTNITYTSAPTTKTTTTQKPNITYTSAPTTKTTTSQKNTNITYTSVPTTKTATTQKPNITYTPAPTTKTATTQKPNVSYTQASANKTTTTQKPNVTYNPAPNNKTRITQKPKTTVGKTTPTTAKPGKAPSGNVTPIPKGGIAKKNKTRVVKKKPGNKEGETAEYAYEYEYDYEYSEGGEGGDVSNKTSGSGKGAKTGNAKKKRTRIKARGKQEVEEPSQEYKSFEGSVDENGSQEEGSAGSEEVVSSGRGRERGRKGYRVRGRKGKKHKGFEEAGSENGSWGESWGTTVRSRKGKGRHGPGKRHRHGENYTSSEEIGSSYNGSHNGTRRSYRRDSGERSNKHKHGYKFKGGKRHRKGENSTRSEEQGSTGDYYSYSHNGTSEELGGSYRQGSYDRHDKRRHGYKYKGGKRHKHGENSTSSEEFDNSGGYYSYSNNETDDGKHGSYRPGGKESADKHRHGYKYKGGKRHKNGENSTSSEDVDHSGGYYSYSYNGTDEDQDRSYRRGSKESSDKHRHGYKYKGGKRHKHGENSSSSEDDYSGGYYRYSYNGTDKGQDGNYRRGSIEKSDKRKHGYKYKGGKRHKHGENSTSSEDVDYSGGYYSYSYNGTDKDQDRSYRRGSKESSDKHRHGYKYKGGKRHKHGKNSTSSEEDYSGDYYRYSYNGTDEGQDGNYRRGSKEKSDKRKHGYKYKGGKRHKYGENSTSSEELDYSGDYYSYSYNGSDEGQDGSYGRKGQEKSDKRRHGYKYKGGKRHKHGENSSSSEELDYSGGYYSYSYNGTGEGQDGSYRRGSIEKSDQRKHGYKYKGGKRHKYGENSTSSEELDYSGDYYSYSYNGTGEGQDGSYRRGSIEKSDKRKHGYKYKGGKSHNHGENSTSSEEADYSGGYSYSYNGSVEDKDGGNKKSYKRKNGYRYIGEKRLKQNENSTSSEDIDHSVGYSNSYNGTIDETKGSYIKGSQEISYKSNGRKRGHRRGKNPTGSYEIGSSSGVLSLSNYINESFIKYGSKMYKRQRGGRKNNGRKRVYGNRENSTGSEEVGSKSGFLSYNEGENNIGESHAQDTKTKNDLRYKGRKRGYRHGGNFTNSGDLGSRSGGSYSNNGTWNETSGSNTANRIERLYKQNSRLRNGTRKNLEKANSTNGAKYRHRGKYRKGGKLRKKNGNAGGIGEGHSGEELEYGSGEFSYNGSAATGAENDGNGNGSQKERNKGKKYRSGKYKVNGKFRNRKTNKGEREDVNNLNRTEEYYEYYEDGEYNDGAGDNETGLTQHSNKSGSVRVKGKNHKTGKHRLGGKVNGRESNSSVYNSTNGDDEYYYYTYYETYEDSNGTESYDLGTEDQGLSVDQAVDSQSGAGTQAPEGTGSGGAQENAEKSSASKLETSSDSGSGYWREEWTEAPSYGEYYTWEKEYEGEEYEVTDQPTS